MTPYSIFIGTSSADPAHGIYHFHFDFETGTPTTPTLVAALPQPNFLTLHPDGKTLYAAGEAVGRVHAFTLGADRVSLTPLNTADTGGRDPCHVAVSPDGRWLAVANYSGGNTAVFHLNPDGSIGARACLHQPTGHGPHPHRQTTPHAHGVAFSRDGTSLLVADLGLDCIHRLPVPPTPPTRPAVRGPRGGGARQTTLSPDGKHLYLINELTSTVSVFNGATGQESPEPIQTVPLLPPEFTGENTAAALAVSPDGRHLYASNRGHDSLAIFKRDASSGRLAPISHHLSCGQKPRHFALTPDGRWLLVGAQGDHRVNIFSVQTDGSLEPASPSLRIPAPTCVLIG